MPQEGSVGLVHWFPVVGERGTTGMVGENSWKGLRRLFKRGITKRESKNAGLVQVFRKFVDHHGGDKNCIVDANGSPREALIKKGKKTTRARGKKSS